MHEHGRLIRYLSYSLCSRVLMLNPSVGSMVLISSPLNFFKIVVFPALSRPLRNVKVKIIGWHLVSLISSFDWVHWVQYSSDIENESFLKTHLHYKRIGENALRIQH